MSEPADIRDETCTNLSILLSLLIRNIKPGETVAMRATGKQLNHIQDILSSHGLIVQHEPLPPDLLITVCRPEQ